MIYMMVQFNKITPVKEVWLYFERPLIAISVNPLSLWKRAGGKG